jgi:hypothetical protein
MQAALARLEALESDNAGVEVVDLNDDKYGSTDDEDPGQYLLRLGATAMLVLFSATYSNIQCRSASIASFLWHVCILSVQHRVIFNPLEGQGQCFRCTCFLKIHDVVIQ